MKERTERNDRKNEMIESTKGKCRLIRSEERYPPTFHCRNGTRTKHERSEREAEARMTAFAEEDLLAEDDGFVPDNSLLVLTPEEEAEIAKVEALYYRTK